MAGDFFGLHDPWRAYLRFVQIEINTVEDDAHIVPQRFPIEKPAYLCYTEITQNLSKGDTAVIFDLLKHSDIHLPVATLGDPVACRKIVVKGKV